MDLRPLFNVGITIAMSGSTTPAQIDAMKAEASLLWKPYGVVLTWFDRADDCSFTDTHPWITPVDTLINIVADGPGGESGVRPGPSMQGRDVQTLRLGNVRFTDRGEVDRVVHLDLSHVQAMVVESSLGGVAIHTWPPPVRDRIIGRALGRVVAHELGHILLAMPSHSHTGLMRATLSAADLSTPGREHLTLTKAFVARLQLRMVALRSSPDVTPTASRP